MLHLKNKSKIKIAGLKGYKNLTIEKELASGDKTLAFSYPKTSKYYSDIEEECYINTKEDEFIVKEKNVGNGYTEFKCILNLEDLEGKPWERYASEEQTIDKALALALAGTGWIVGKCSLKKKRTVRLSNCSSLEVIKEIKKIYRVDLVFNTLSRTIDVYEHLGEDKGTYFIDSLNLKDLSIQGNSYDFFTRIIPIGKDNLRISSINNGKEYVENTQYSNKIKTCYWMDERYTIIENLKEDAEAKLNEISKPYRAYSADIINLAKLNDKYKNILDYKLGDTITLISKDNKFRDKQRIVKIIEHPDEPELDSVEIANTILSFEETQTQFQEATDTVNNITTDNGTVDGSTIDEIETKQIKDFDSEVIKAANIEALNIKVTNLEAHNVTITGELTAVQATIGTLTANVATIDKLTVTHSAYIADLQANKASITQLEAVNATIHVLESNVGNIETLLNGNLSSENIQAGGITSDKLTITNGFITNAMISNLDVAKVNAGDISTNKFRITSDSGNMLISDNTIQIRDKSRVRVQIGKDASNDYNMYVWDANGNMMFDATGLKAHGIKEKIIRDDMISDNANIDGGKLNISSVVTSINNGTTTIKGSKVQIDGTNQTLDVSFNSLKTEVHGIQVGGRNYVIKSNDVESYLNDTDTLLAPGGGFINMTKVSDSTAYNMGAWIYVKVDPGTDYTLGIDIENHKNCLIGIGGVTDSGNIWNKYGYHYPDKEGRFKYTFRTDNSESKIVIFIGIKSSLGKGSKVNFKDLKVEKGTKATDWTPAPEDVEGKINNIKEITTSQSTTISVMQGQIATAINNTQIIKDGQTILLKDDYNRTVQTVDSMKSTIGSHTTQINQSTGKISAVETRVNTVERNLDSITARITSTETKIDNLNIGGRNYIYNSDLKNQFKYFIINGADRPGTIELVEFQGRKCIKFTDIGVWDVSKYLRTNKFWFPEGEYLTFSMDVYLTSGNKFYIDTSGTLDNYDFAIEVKELNKWLRIHGTTINKSKTSGDVSIAIYSTRGSDKISGYITLLKAEIGTNATDWTPAPEDTEDEITETKNKVSAIEVNINSITSKVSSVETTTSTMNGKLTNLLTRMNSAEQKITDSSIISTVSSQFYKKGEADSKYAAQSQITQLSNQIATKVDVNGVKSTIQQSSTDVMIGFNGINDRVNINSFEMAFKNIDGKRTYAIVKGQANLYNPQDATLLGSMVPRSTLGGSYLSNGISTVISANGFFYSIAKASDWTGDGNVTYNPIEFFILNFKDVNGTPQGKAGAHFHTTLFPEAGIDMHNKTIDNTGLIYADLMCSDRWRRRDNGANLFSYNSSWNHIDLHLDLECNYKTLKNARIQAAYSFAATSPGTSVGADTASVETMLLQEEFSEYDDLNNMVVVDLNEGFKSVYGNHKKLENENEQLKQENKNLKEKLLSTDEELAMTKNALDTILMNAV